MINYARLSNSPRLQRVAALLADGYWHSTRDIQAGANVCAVNSCMDELRCNGVACETRQVGRGRWEYRRVVRQEQEQMALEA